MNLMTKLARLWQLAQGPMTVHGTKGEALRALGDHLAPGDAVRHTGVTVHLSDLDSSPARVASTTFVVIGVEAALAAAELIQGNALVDRVTITAGSGRRFDWKRDPAMVTRAAGLVH